MARYLRPGQVGDRYVRVDNIYGQSYNVLVPATQPMEAALDVYATHAGTAGSSVHLQPHTMTQFVREPFWRSYAATPSRVTFVHEPRVVAYESPCRVGSEVHLVPSYPSRTVVTAPRSLVATPAQTRIVVTERPLSAMPSATSSEAAVGVSHIMSELSSLRTAMQSVQAEVESIRTRADGSPPQPQSPPAAPAPG